MTESIALPVGTIPEQREPEERGSLELLGAGLRTESSLFSALSKESIDSQPNYDFDAVPEIIGSHYEQYAPAFLNANSTEDVFKIKAQLDREIADRKMLDESGGEGVLMRVAGGILDPITFVPVAGVASKAYKGARLANIGIGAMRGAGAAVAGTAAAETALHATQYTRTKEETLYALSGATVLGGMIGGAAPEVRRLFDRVKTGSFDEAADSVKTDLENILNDRPTISEVGAAQTVTTTLKDEGLKGAAYVDKVLKFMNPHLRMNASPSVVARRETQKIIENPNTLEKNIKGIATGTEGGAAETLIKAADGELYKLYSELDDAFIMERKGRAKRLGDITRQNITDMFTADAGTLTRKRFNEEAAKAARRGDVSENPNIQRAAVAYRELADSLKDQAIEVGLLPKDIDTSTALSYVTRVYNKERIIAKRGEFVGELERWFIRSSKGEMDELEARSAAQQVTDRILGTPDGRLPYDAEVGEVSRQLGKIRPTSAGQFKERTLSIPDEFIEEFLENDIEVLSRTMVRSMAPDIQLAKKFGPTVAPASDDVIAEANKLYLDAEKAISAAGTDAEKALAKAAAKELGAEVKRLERFKKADFTGTEAELDVIDDFNRMIEDVDKKVSKGEITEAKGMKERKSLQNAKASWLKDFAAMRDRLRGTYKMPEDSTSWAPRAARVAMDLNYLRLLGGMVISAIPDPARIVMTHGLARTFNGAIKPFFTNIKGMKLATEEMKLIGVGLDMTTNSRMGAMADLRDEYGRHSKFERGLQGLTNANGLATLMAPWNAAMRQAAGVVTMTRVLDACEAAAKGTITAKEIEKLAASGINVDTAKSIFKQYKKHGANVKGIKIANALEWDADRSTIDAFRSAILRDVDRTIVTPGVGDKPLWTSTVTGKLFAEFKSFGFASVNRVMITGLQDRDASAVSGALLMMGLGGLVYKMKTELSGRETSDDIMTWVGEGVDRSGMFGIVTDGVNIGLKAAGLSGQSRYASRSVYEAFMGPTFGSLADLGARVATDSAQGEFDAKTLRAARRLIPYQNLFYTRSTLDKAERGIARTLGLKGAK